MKMDKVIGLMHDALNRVASATDNDEVEINFLPRHESDITVRNYKLFLQRLYKSVEESSYKPCNQAYDAVIDGLVDDGYVDIDCELIRTMGIDATHYQHLSVAQKMQVHCLTTAAQTIINTKKEI